MAHESSGLHAIVVVTTFSRLVLNTARRFAYPFAPALSRGLGISLSAVSGLIAVNQATALIGPFIAPIGDRFGYRTPMILALLLMGCGMLAAGFFPSYASVLWALFLAGSAKNVFDPAIQAYVSKRIPFERRGLVIALMELSWAGSTLLGIPLIGLMIEKWGWQAPFFLLGALSIIQTGALCRVVGKDRGASHGKRDGVSIMTMWPTLLQQRAPAGALGFAFFFSMANDILFVAYGAWFEQSFDVGVALLGMCTAVIGMAELAGECATAIWADKIGLKRSCGLGLILCVLSYTALPVIGRDLSSAMVGMFVLFLAFEFTMVSFLSLSTELIPEARATMMSGFFAAAGAGRMFGALIGGPVWVVGGILATGMTSAAVTLLASGCAVWGMRSWRAPTG